MGGCPHARLASLGVPEVPARYSACCVHREYPHSVGLGGLQMTPVGSTAHRSATRERERHVEQCVHAMHSGAAVPRMAVALLQFADTRRKNRYKRVAAAASDLALLRTRRACLPTTVCAKNRAMVFATSEPGEAQALLRRAGKKRLQRSAGLVAQRLTAAPDCRGPSLDVLQIVQNQNFVEKINDTKTNELDIQLDFIGWTLCAGRCQTRTVAEA